MRGNTEYVKITECCTENQMKMENAGAPADS